MRFGVRDWAERDPGRMALEFVDGRVLSYGELEALANRFAHLYRRSGLRIGDHVAVVLGNDPHMVAAVWGGYRAGVYLTPIATTFSASEIAYVLANSTARLVVADARLAKAWPGLLDRVRSVERFLTTGGVLGGSEALEAALADLPATPLADESPGALMMYSSGTTGEPKGIWRPLPSMDQIGDGAPPFARDLLQIFGMNAATRYLSPAPLYHAAALRYVLAMSAAGGTSLIMDRFEAGLALDLLQDRAITMSQWVPTMLQRMLALSEERRRRFRAPEHRTAFHAAAPCPPQVKRAMIDWWGPILREYYSGSEGVGLATIDSSEWLARPGSVGKVVKGVPHIIGEDGRELGPGETGAIYFSGIPCFAYFGEPDKTAARTSPQGYQTFGDVGHLDQDGYLFLTDRLDDMIISGGVNLYPQEIEIALEEAAGVAECAVVGAADEDFGERPVAYVVRAKGHPGSDEGLVRELATYCLMRLGRTKQPRDFRLVDSLPRSATGKLLRRVLRNRVGGGPQD